MEKQSKTLIGRWSTLQDTAKEAFGEVTEGLSDWLASDGIPAAIDAVEWLGNNFEKLIPILGSVAAAAASFYIAFKFSDIVNGITNVISSMTSMTGVISLSVSALAAFATYIITASMNAMTAGEKFATLSQSEQALIENTKNAAEQWRDLNNAANKSIVSYQTQIGGIQALVGELKKLVDENGNVTAANQERVNFILTTLNEALGTEYQLVDGQIKQYQTMIGTIDQVIAAQMKQYAIDELMPAYIQALGQQDELLNTIRISEQGLKDQTEITERARAEAMNTMTLAAIINASKQQATLSAMEEDHNTLVTSWIEGQTAIQNMNQITALSSDATQEEISTALATTEEDIEKARRTFEISSMGIGNSLTNMAQSGGQSLGNLKTDFSSMADSAQAETGNAIGAIQNAGWEYVASSASNAVVNGFNPYLYNNGVAAVDGAINGMNARQSLLISTARKLGADVTSAFNAVLKIKSPSRVMEESGENVVLGAAEGIEDNAHLVEDAAESLGAGVISSFSYPINPINTTAFSAGQAMHQMQMQEFRSNLSAQMQSAPINVVLQIDGNEFATATALPMSYALESLRLAEMRG